MWISIAGVRFIMRGFLSSQMGHSLLVRPSVFIIAGAIAAIDSAVIIAMMAYIVFDCSYDIDGFQILFFTEKQIQDLASAEGFEILWIKEEYEEPVTLYLVSSRKV